MDIESRGNKQTTLGSGDMGNTYNKVATANTTGKVSNVDTFYIFGCIPIEDKHMSDEDESNMNWFYGISLLAAIVIIATVTPSFWYVNYSQYTLDMNTYTGVRLKDTNGEGRYFLPLTEQMVYFPATYQYVEFVSESFADNGLEFDIHVGFYYRLPKDNVGAIYDSFSTNYGSRVENNAKRLVKNMASTFTVKQYQENRTYIEESIAVALETDLLDTVLVEAPRSLFKITNIKFPDTLVDTSLQTAEALQQNEIEEFLQDIDVIHADTNKQKAEIDARAVQKVEFANNEGAKLIANSISESNQIVLVARSDGINNVCEELNITNPVEKNRLVNAFAIMDNVNDPKILHDLRGSVLVST